MTIDRVSSRDTSGGDSGPRVIDLTADDADDVFAALSGETAREILDRIYCEPMTMTELAEELETTVQNVDYHMRKLANADLVSIADTVYSEKRREMKVWGPSYTSIAIIGTRSPLDYIKGQLHTILGVFIILAGATALLSLLISEFLSGEPDVTPFAGGGDSILLILSKTMHDPIVAFFLGGILVLFSFVAIGIATRQRRAS